jgi:hypothetical protein
MPESNTPIGRARLSLEGEPRDIPEAGDAPAVPCDLPFTDAGGTATPEARLRTANPLLAISRARATPVPADGPPFVEFAPRFAIV